MHRTKLVVALTLAMLAALGTVGVAAATVPTDSKALRNAVSATTIVTRG